MRRGCSSGRNQISVEQVLRSIQPPRGMPFPHTRGRCLQHSADSSGNDLYNAGDSIISVIVDTFTVLNPDSTHAFPLDKFTFDILNDTIAIAAEIEDEKLVPLLFNLSQNYPNPFNPKTTIEFSIANTEFVTLKIYNLLGQEVATLISEELSAGSHKNTWDASYFASGVYFYQIQTESFADTKKLILLK